MGVVSIIIAVLESWKPGSPAYGLDISLVPNLSALVRVAIEANSGDSALGVNPF